MSFTDLFLLSVESRWHEEDDDGGQLSVLVADENGRMSQSFTRVKKTRSVHRVRCSISGQHASHDSRSVVYVHLVTTAKLQNCICLQPFL